MLKVLWICYSVLKADQRHASEYSRGETKVESPLFSLTSCFFLTLIFCSLNTNKFKRLSVVLLHMCNWTQATWTFDDGTRVFPISLSGVKSQEKNKKKQNYRRSASVFPSFKPQLMENNKTFKKEFNLSRCFTIWGSSNECFYLRNSSNIIIALRLDGVLNIFC